MKRFFLLILLFSFAPLSVQPQSDSGIPIEEMTDEMIEKLAEKMLKEEKEYKKARIRFFNGTLKSNLTIQLLTSSGEKIETPLGQPITYTGYTTLDPGKINLSLLEKTESSNTPPVILFESEHELKEKEYFTGVVLHKEGKYSLHKLIDNFDFNSKNTYDIFAANFTENIPVTIKNKNTTLGTLEFGDYIELKDSSEFPYLTAFFNNLNLKEGVPLVEGHDNLKSLMIYIRKDRYGYITHEVLQRGPEQTVSKEEIINMLKQERDARRQAAAEQNQLQP
jgi:hypothetical protein